MPRTCSTLKGLAFEMPLPLTCNTQSNRILVRDHGRSFHTRRDDRARISMAATRDARTPVNSRIQAGQNSVHPKYIRRTGMNIPVVVSKELQDVFGGSDISNRSQILADLCKYVRENDLYVGDHKKIVSCDERLSSLLHVVGEVQFWEIFRLLNRHLKDPSDLGPEYELRANEFFEKYLEQRGAVVAPPRSRDPRGVNSAATQKRLRRERQGMFAEVHIEPCLRPLCGGKCELPRPEVLKSVWAFIKKNKLQDATNGRRVRVTETLRDALRLPNVEWIDSFRLGGYVFKLTSKKEQNV
eukprot:TRINITY_DN386_c0_g3_i1.p1 TRINITY_DN386_c0_g3~~TRINITY_DN386_c0_g3_i1.p1  ORF type:complete len:298 (-),score=27.54 TRINITY_DN386_c0_g3_i1:270-1163(-)